MTVSLHQGDSLLTWRAVAKDGADLPAGQTVDRPATLFSEPGEVYDFDFTAPAAGGAYTLSFGDPKNPRAPTETRLVALRVH